MSQIKINNPEDLARFLKTPAIREIESRTGGKLRRHKYRAVATEYRGIKYPSKAQALYAEWLDEQQQEDEILWWNAAPCFRLGCPENVYWPDMMVVDWSGEAVDDEGNIGPKVPLIYMDDVKGRETDKFRKDKRLWAAYGPCPLRIVTLDLRYPVGVSKLDAKPEIIGINYEIIQGSGNTWAPGGSD